MRIWLTETSHNTTVSVLGRLRTVGIKFSSKILFSEISDDVVTFVNSIDEPVSS